MFGRESYTRQEFDQAKAAIDQAVATYKRIAKAARAAPATTGDTALRTFEATYFNDLTIVLDRHFVHRLRTVTGTDGTPINEVEMLRDSLMNNGGVLRASSVITFIPERSVLKLRVGDPIRNTEEQFERLSSAFFAELKQKFLVGLL